MKLKELRDELESLADREMAEFAARYFKTGPGEYGEGDTFLGIRTPDLRKVARKFKGLSLEETERLLRSEIHEERFVALAILVNRFKKGGDEEKEKIYRMYLVNSRYINNWDLVDVSVKDIVGAFLWEKDRGPLYELAGSDNLWERRMAIMATFFFIKQGELKETFRIAEMLLHDPEDLIHKAVGWMLREAGKRDREAEEEFLEKHYREMPRTMLRYAIEKFPEERRKAYLGGKV